jgi:ribosomal protein L25 (general stress protein Ctc)
MIEVTNEIKVYEIDGKEIKALNYPLMKIISHRNYDSRISIEIDGKTYTVIASDLRAAIANATNVGSY